MAFTKNFRTKFPQDVEARFRCYWHVMHPVTFSPDAIYRAGWTDESWAAFQLLLEGRPEVLAKGYRWSYEWIWGQLELPNYVPSRSSLSWAVKGGHPSIAVQESELPVAEQEKLRAWILEAYRYKDLGQFLRAQLLHLLRVNYHHTGPSYAPNTTETSICNTPATLLAIWPELIPFMPPEERDVMRHRHMKPSPPRVWTEENNTVFFADPRMAQLTEALSTMSLIPNVVDEDYPTLSG